jgi:hypothetical protein
VWSEHVSGGFALILLVLAVSSCAGTSRESHGDWREQTNAICDRWDQEVHRLGAARELKQVAIVTRRASKLARGYIERLQMVRPPTRERARFDRMVVALEGSTSALEAVSRAAAAGDESALTRADAAYVRAVDVADERVNALGTSQCLSNDG